MDLNQIGEISHTATDVHVIDGTWNLNGMEEGLDAFVGLKRVRDMHDSQGGVGGEGVFRREEVLFTKAHHGAPVKPNDDYDDCGVDINYGNISPEETASDVANGEHGKNVTFGRINKFEIV